MKKKVILILILIILLSVFTNLYHVYCNSGNVVALSSEGIKFGSDSAKIKIYFYTSFSCSKCKQLSANIREAAKGLLDSNEVQIIYKITDDYVYNWSNDKFYDYDFITNGYENWMDYATIDESESLSAAELEKRKEIKGTIEQEMELNKIEGVPVFFVNNEKFNGLYSTEEISKILSKEE
ncbi:protein-disulfide isomerase [Lachnotalea glycerini]|jgi:protein-disulfide isomerase|uniref:Protein-disulfide isomerase n=1 Tax=Lachnotalea glycerini TaxID=1763509 RepID=A0A255IMN6_9FIRM|nr:thioredoxin domain-containing protein [Lachnotalea glycerini]PXV86715.1 protein-disulfide isomerase [Lachnotalea glycerini]RDY32211.1 hypothetical protein CG710_005900 [Lachnotalea glycerini]